MTTGCDLKEGLIGEWKANRKYLILEEKANQKSFSQVCSYAVEDHRRINVTSSVHQEDV